MGCVVDIEGGVHALLEAAAPSETHVSWMARMPCGCIIAGHKFVPDMQIRALRIIVLMNHPPALDSYLAALERSQPYRTLLFVWPPKTRCLKLVESRNSMASRYPQRLNIVGC
jgi:hypothetical protein